MNKIEVIKEFIEQVDFECSCPHECNKDTCDTCYFHTIPKRSLLARLNELKDTIDSE